MAAVAVIGSCAVVMGILTILLLLAVGDRGPADRDVVIVLPATETYSETVPAPSAGVDGGLVVSPLTSTAFSRLPALAPDAPLPPAPDPTLIQIATNGRLPVISADGRLPRDVYARPHDPRDQRARLVIIISEIGLSRSASEAAIERLPGAVVLAIDAYAVHPDDWAAAARRSGHETLATIPLESAGVGFRDDGPRALRVAASADENVRRLDAVLGSLAGYVGVLAVGGTVLAVGGTPFGEDAACQQPMLDRLQARGLLLVDAAGCRKTMPIGVAGRFGPSLIRVDVRIEDSLGAAMIDRRLIDLQTIARERSVGVALARPYPQILERLRTWISALDDRRFVLAPVSAALNRDGL